LAVNFCGSRVGVRADRLACLCYKLSKVKIKNAARRCGCGEGCHEMAIGLVRLNCLVAACARAVFCPAE
jgi:hypothetical protein